MSLVLAALSQAIEEDVCHPCDEHGRTADCAILGRLWRAFEQTDEHHFNITSLEHLLMDTDDWGLDVAD
jgi:hypothetical protein